MRFRDLGLTYEQACHAMQTGVAFEMNLPKRARATEPKHLRVGVNAALADQSGLVQLLIDKGIFTAEEYLEAIRLAMNEEVARYQDLHPGMKFR